MSWIIGGLVVAAAIGAILWDKQAFEDRLRVWDDLEDPDPRDTPAFTFRSPDPGRYEQFVDRDNQR